ncbi:MAG: tetratricopeptide repeat protein [Saprospiraceae bacterium]|nr:tetratricopeptide repeat protein [Candidatus Vicinibacter affinis]
MQTYKRLLGDNSIDYASSLEMLASIHKEQAAFRKALEYYNQALLIYLKSSSPITLKFH